MQDREAISSVQGLIDHYRGIADALQTALDLMVRAGAAPVASPKALPAPARQRRTAVSSDEEATFTQEIDGVIFACTEQQHAFIEMLGAHDYVPGSMVYPLFDNSKGKFETSLKDLRGRLVQANVAAQIVGYRSRGFRLEKIEAEA